MQIGQSVNSLNPFVPISRDDRVEKSAQKWIKENEKQGHDYCFLCSTLIPNSTRVSEKQIAICKKFLTEVDPANYRYSNELNLESKSCQNCAPEVLKVWNLHEEMVLIRKQIAEILSSLVQKGNSDLAPSTSDSVINSTNESEIDPCIQSTSCPGIKIEVASTDTIIDTTGNEINIVGNVFTGGPATLRKAALSNNLVVQTKDVQSNAQVSTISTGDKSTNRTSSQTKVKYRLCNKTLLTRNHLALHVARTHNHPCSSCGKKFPTEKQRIVHEVITCKVVHSPETLKAFGGTMFACTVDGCRERYLNLQSLNFHVRLKHGAGRQYDCSICGRNFPRQGDLSVHEEQCQILDSNNTATRNLAIESFTDRHNHAEASPTVLPIIPVPNVAHLKTDIKRRPLRRKKCDHCGKVFYGKIRLTHHVRAAHDKVKVKHPCSVCGKGWSSAWSCAAHEALRCGVVHSPDQLKRVGLKLRKCEVASCPHIFPSDRDVQRHLLTVHKNLFRCSTCEKCYTSSQELAVHGRLCGNVESLKMDSQVIKIETETSPNESTESFSSIDVVHGVAVGEQIVETAQLLRKSSGLKSIISATANIYGSHAFKVAPQRQPGLPKRGEMCEELKIYYAQHNLKDFSRAAYCKFKCPCSVCGMLLPSPKDCVAHEVIMCKVAHPPELLDKMSVSIITCSLAGCEQLFWREQDLVNHVNTNHKYEGGTT